MQRIALSLFLLSMSALAAAQVVTPSFADGDGSGGNCPDAVVTETPAAAMVSGEGRPDDVPAPPAAAAAAAGEVSARSAPARATPSVRPKAPMRWHSFLPGMMK